jgi:hypothetical protein
MNPILLVFFLSLFFQFVVIKAGSSDQNIQSSKQDKNNCIKRTWSAVVRFFSQILKSTCLFRILVHSILLMGVFCHLLSLFSPTWEKQNESRFSMLIKE